VAAALEAEVVKVDTHRGDRALVVVEPETVDGILSNW
jgi:hypothetical protein